MDTYKKKIIRAPALQVPYSDQSVYPSIHLSFLRSLVQGISSLHLAQSKSYFNYRVPLGNWCAVSLNKVSRSKV